MKLIDIQNVTKVYQMGKSTFEALKGITLSIMPKELVAIVGHSGSGKSTLMNIIGLLSKQTSGSYFLNGKDVSKLSPNELARLRNEEIGFVFQSFLLLPRMTAIQNVMLPLIYRGMRASERYQRALAQLKKVGMEQYIDHLPTELSGGQQQRVAIARALAGSPTLILADEPTGALDSKTSQDVMDIMKGLNKEGNTTVVIITHDLDVADQCQRQVKLEDGRIVS